MAELTPRRLPIACALRSGELAARKAELAALASRELLSRTNLPGGVRLRFAPGARNERRLRDAIAAEAACCPFLTIDLRGDGDGWVVDITGPEDAAPVIADLFVPDATPAGR